MENFHILIGIATVIHYALLRKLFKKNNKESISKKNYILYILILPILLYVLYYIFKEKQNGIDQNLNNVITNANLDNTSSILTMPYPDSSNISLTSI